MKSDSYKNIFHFFLVAIIVSICYSGTLENSWHFDDSHNIIENKNIQINIDNISWANIKSTFYSPEVNRIDRPLARFSFALNYLFSGLDTTSYHIVNIIIHIVCSIFIYLVFIITLFVYREKNSIPTPDYLVRDIALLGAVFWAIHPIQTQAVTYIVQRMASMAAMWYMISLYCYLKFRVQKEPREKKILFLILSVLFWIAGMLTKENAALLPFSVIAYEIILFQNSLRTSLKFKILFLVCLLSVAVVSFLFMSGDIIENLSKAYVARPFTMWERLITQPIILTKYIMLILVPVADFLTLESNIFASKNLFSPSITIVANIFILLLIFFSIFFSKKYSLLCFALIFYFINHLVESSIIGLELYFEHRNYLPSVFIYLIVSYFFVTICIYYRRNNKKFMYSLFVVFTTFIVICEGNATYLRNEVWRDEISLNLDNIEKAPLNVRGYNNLAAEYIALRQHDKALEFLKQGEEIYNKNPEIYPRNQIANFYFNAGLIELHAKENAEKAAQLFMKSVELDPTDFKTHYQLAIAFFKLGDLVNAEAAISNADQLVQFVGDQSKRIQIYNLFGRILYAVGKYELAIEVLSKGLEIEKRREIYFNLAASYIAIEDYKSARTSLIAFDADEDDLLYLLYKLILVSESEMDSLIKKIISIMQKKKIDYCKWLKETNENNHVGIIFPDVSQVKEKLKQAYIIDREKQIQAIMSENVLIIQCI